MSLPVRMRVIEITEPGPAEVLRMTERPVPAPANHEVLIQVAAAGINRPDIMQRQGMYPPPPGASDIPGLEIAGTIIALGKQVTRLKSGDTVCALVTGGGYAEYCTAPAALCLPLPHQFSTMQAAALPETFFTVWSNVFDRARLAAGETLLVHGGAGGIGSTAIQLAKAFNACVIATVGCAEKFSFCENLGATAINYKTDDFVAAVQELTNHKGVDVILDIIGGDYFPRNIKCMATDARLLQIAIQNGPQSEINLLSVMLKRLTITGSTLRARGISYKAKIAEKLISQVWPKFVDGRIKPIIHSTFPLHEASQAHVLMEAGNHIGKIILTT